MRKIILAAAIATSALGLAACGETAKETDDMGEAMAADAEANAEAVEATAEEAGAAMEATGEEVAADAEAAAANAEAEVQEETPAEAAAD